MDMKSNKPDIAEVIRKSRGFQKQGYYAEQLGISQPSLSNIEKRCRKPSIEVLKKFSKLTGKPLVYLINITYGD